MSKADGSERPQGQHAAATTPTPSAANAQTAKQGRVVGPSYRKPVGRKVRQRGSDQPTVAAPAPTPTDTPVDVACRTVTEAWQQPGLDQDLSGYAELLNRWEMFLTSLGVTRLDQITAELAYSWVTAPHSTENNRAARRFTGSTIGQPVSTTVMHARRGCLRRFFRDLRALGLYAGDPTQDIALPARTNRKPSALTDAEIQRIRRTCKDTPHQTLLPAAVALALATATTAEIVSIRLDDLRLNHGLVWLHSDSGGHHDRWGQLDDWGVNALADRVASMRRLGHNKPHDLIAYTSDPATPQAKRTAAGNASLRRTLLLADITRRDAVSTSFQDYVAARILDETGRLEAVAARMGLRNLDRAEQLTGYQWRTQFSITGPADEARS